TLQDDVYVLVQDGWAAGKKVRELVAKKGEKLTETADLTVKRIKYKMELIPPALIVQRYFAEQQTQLDQLQATLDEIIQQQDSLIEEHTSEEGLLAEALSDSDKVTKATVTARLKHATDAEEREVLQQAKQLFDLETTAKAQLKTAQEQLDAAVLAQYGKLSEADIKQLLVADKWLATLQAQIEAEIERITQQLASRLQELKQRYSEPLPEITANVEQLSLKVAEHLKAMGLTL
ncbi:MAG: type I restriction endonuclease subunit M, partial [Pseudomonas sp.]|nr:type I restriction endonuclease subunit M [Pseudomonas sp.]